MANEQLVVQLEARIRDFERQMQRANKTATTQFSSIERRGNKMTKNLQGMGSGAFASLIKGATLALAPILGVTAALNTAKAAMTDFDKIGKQAKSAGVDSEFFQELGVVAELGGSSVEQLSQALNIFNKNTGLAAIGTGDLYAKLGKLNPELLKNILATTDQAERVRLAADAIDKAGSASAKAALATTLFGDAGAKMVEVFKGGSIALAETANKARELGLVIDRDMIKKSEDLNDQFSLATKIMDTQFKQALIDVAPFLIEAAKLAGNVAKAIGYISQSMQDLENRTTTRLQTDLTNLDSLMASASAQMAPGVVGNMGVQIDPAGVADLKKQRDTIFAELKKRAIDQLKIGLVQPSGGGGAVDPTTPTTTRSAAASEAVKQAEAVAKLVDQYKFEGDQLGRNANAQELYNALKSAGVTAESEYGQAIAGALGPLQAQRDAIQRNADAMAEFQGMAKDAMGTFIDDLMAGKSVAESLGDVLNNLGSQLLKSGLSALGNAIFPGLGSAAGSLFADGGTTGPAGFSNIEVFS